MEIALIIFVGYVGIALLNSWMEGFGRIRCGAREGLFGTCSVPVDSTALRCARHRGQRRRRWP